MDGQGAQHKMEKHCEKNDQCIVPESSQFMKLSGRLRVQLSIVLYHV